MDAKYELVWGVGALSDDIMGKDTASTEVGALAHHDATPISNTTDTDTQLTEGQVDAFVANNNYSTGAHTTDTDTPVGLPRDDGFAAKYSAAVGVWDSASDYDSLPPLSRQPAVTPFNPAPSCLSDCGADRDTHLT